MVYGSSSTLRQSAFNALLIRIFSDCFPACTRSLRIYEFATMRRIHNAKIHSFVKNVFALFRLTRLTENWPTTQVQYKFISATSFSSSASWESLHYTYSFYYPRVSQKKFEGRSSIDIVSTYFGETHFVQNLLHQSELCFSQEILTLKFWKFRVKWPALKTV